MTGQIPDMADMLLKDYYYWLTLAKSLLACTLSELMPKTSAPASLNFPYASLKAHASLVHPGVAACASPTIHSSVHLKCTGSCSLVVAKLSIRRLRLECYLWIKEHHHWALALKLGESH